MFVLLFGALFVMVFGWTVKSTISGSNKAGFFGDAAVAIASFPTLAKTVFSDVQIDALYNDITIRVPRTNADLSDFVVIDSKSGIDVKGLVMQVNNKELLSRASGWRILVGAFTIDDEMKNAAVALSSDLEIVKVWLLEEEVTGVYEVRAPHRKFIHGFDILDDGSVIFSFDGGATLQRIDKCGNRVWVVEGLFHHSVTLDDKQQFVWTLRFPGDVVQVATATGEIGRHFTMDDVIMANPDIDILEIRRSKLNDNGGNSRNTTERWLNDPFHLNDVDPLPSALAGSYEGFDAGDLMLSARNLNLVFVLDPVTLKIKWWRTGATKNQHDPDWSSTGKITVFDNRMSRDYSRIISLDLKSYGTKSLLDGRKINFYSRIRGKHQITEAGNILVTSTQQGRVFEVDMDGNRVLEIINKKLGSDKFNYVISEAIWLPSKTLNFRDNLLCKN
ncbi:MAG: hypothetical protein ACI9JR_000995 [Gammaproteobacteria bacterium]|jgi:hypothetical protein